MKGSTDQKRIWAHAAGMLCALLMLLLSLCAAGAENADVNSSIKLFAPEETVFPSLSTQIRFILPEQCTFDLILRDDDGNLLSVIVLNHTASAGENIIHWNGTYQGEAAPEGTWRLCLETENNHAEARIKIGSPAPRLIGVAMEDTVSMTGSVASLKYYATQAGTLLLKTLDETNGENEQILSRQNTSEGDGELTWYSPLTEGNYTLSLTLTNSEGITSEESILHLTVLVPLDSDDMDDGEDDDGDDGRELKRATEYGSVSEPSDGTEADAAAEPESDSASETEPDVEAETEPDVEVETEPATSAESEADVTAGDSREKDVSGEEESSESKDTDTDTDMDADKNSPAQNEFTPSWSSPYPKTNTTPDYWTTPMDIHDEAAVWAALTSPITVIDNGKGEKAQIILRRYPAQDSEGVGTITCSTQGVRVIERGDEWSLVECYSSSFHDSPILNWNALVQGYVLTEYLTEITPNQELGYVIDKLTQRLYVFREGHLYSTLVISTGLSNKRQPYNETRSGEFLLTSKVGTFSSDNLRCGLAIRFNKGDLLHEVPYTLLSDGGANYKSCEAKLGIKASHGCIRVQRKNTPEGVNMAWIWKNYKKNTRLIIWEDWQGRQMEIPSDDFTIYYNPKGGKFYHSQEHCASVSRANFSFTPFEYGQLDEKPFSKLKRCEYCAPVLRKAEIEEINAQYAWGGDHDPVLTEALESCPKPLK